MLRNSKVQAGNYKKEIGKIQNVIISVCSSVGSGNYLDHFLYSFLNHAYNCSYCFQLMLYCLAKL